MNGLVVVLPCRDAPGALAGCLAELPDALRAEAIVVDDGSAEPLRAEGATLLRHPQVQGWGAAQKTGYAAALARGAERVVLLRADGRHRTSEVLALAEGLETAHQRGVDLVLGARDRREGGRARALAERGLVRLLNRRFQVQLSDPHGGALAVRADALRLLHLHRYRDDEGFDAQLLCSLLARGLRVAEAPVRLREDTSRLGAAHALLATDAWAEAILWPPG